MDQLHLEKLTWDNYDAIINLHVSKEQRNFSCYCSGRWKRTAECAGQRKKNGGNKQ